MLLTFSFNYSFERKNRRKSQGKNEKRFFESISRDAFKEKRTKENKEKRV